MKRLLVVLMCGWATACGDGRSLDPSGRELSDAADTFAVGSGYSRPATPEELPEGFPFGPDVGPAEADGSGQPDDRLSLCDEVAPGPWTDACGERLCGRCGTDGDCAEGETCSEGACLASAVPEEVITILPERSLQLFGAPARLTNFWASLVRDGVTVRRYFDVVRDTPADTKLSFAVYRQVVPPSGEPLPEGSGDLVIEERWVGGFADRSLLREALAMETMAALTDQPMGRGEHRLVRVNGEVYGPMFIYQAVDEPLLGAAGRDTDAPRYAADGSGEVYALGGGSLVPLPEGRYAEAFKEESSAADDFAPLASFVEGAIAADAAAQEGDPGSGACAVRSSLDVAGYLDGLAALALLGDGGHARSNYRISLQPRPGAPSRWEVWFERFALSFGCRWNDADDNGLCGAMDAGESPYVGMFEEAGSAAQYPPRGYYSLLTEVVLSDRELEESFRERICAMIATPFWQTVLPARIVGLGRLLEPLVAADPRDRVEGLEGYRAEVDALLAYHAARTSLLRSQFLCY